MICVATDTYGLGGGGHEGKVMSATQNWCDRPGGGATHRFCRRVVQVDLGRGARAFKLSHSVVVLREILCCWRARWIVPSKGSPMHAYAWHIWRKMPSSGPSLKVRVGRPSLQRQNLPNAPPFRARSIGSPGLGRADSRTMSSELGENGITQGTSPAWAEGSSKSGSGAPLKEQDVLFALLSSWQVLVAPRPWNLWPRLEDVKRVGDSLIFWLRIAKRLLLNLIWKLRVGGRYWS